MPIRIFVAVFAGTLSLISCGFETSEEDKFQDKSKGRVSTTAKDGDATANKKENGDTENGDLDCSGVALHGLHLSCDDDDLAAKDETKDDVVAADDPKKADQPVDKPVEKPGEKPVDKPVENPVPPKDPNIVEFRIKAGTGNGPWNTQAELVNAKIGQTIRITNDDTVIHRLHTGGSPCPHGANIAVGASADCKVTAAFDATVANTVYDHISGTGAKVWFKTVP